MVSAGSSRSEHRLFAAPKSRATPALHGANTSVIRNYETVAKAGRNLTGFIDDYPSSVRSRFCGAAANASVRQVVSFAPTSASGRTNEVFAAISGRL